jgi:UDP-glucose 4-epimerase
LVTGGTDYIGSHTAVELQNAGYEVVIVDNLSNSSLDVLDAIEKITGFRPFFEEFDRIESDKVDAFFVKDPNIEAIIHFAAQGNKRVGNGFIVFLYLKVRHETIGYS